MTDGTQGPDISTIPSIALRQVEVLRDGASAQYGSDAIAGVMNFLLQDAREGGSLELTTGTYRAGDGDAYNVAGNVGLPLGNTGFANLSFEYGNADPTNRSVQRADAAALIAAGNTAVADPAQIWGDPTIEDDLKLFGNFGHAYANGLELYGHANYAGRTATQGFYYRNPNTRANIFSLDSGRTLLVGDALDARDGVRDGSAGCPTVRITDNRPDQAALAQVRADPDCFSFQEIAPGGFTDARSGRQRHRAVDVPGRPAPGRPAARARDVDQRDGRAGGRHRTVHADRRLLPRRRDEPPRAVAELHPRHRRARAAPVRGNRIGAHPRLLPVLHQRLRDPHARPRRRFDLHAAAPGGRHGPELRDERAGRVRLLGRLHYFGSWVDHLDARSARGADAPVLGGRFIVDLEVAVPLTTGVTLAVGGQNVFDTFSDRMDLFASRFGLPYSQFTPWGLSGGYYYARLDYRWGR